MNPEYRTLLNGARAHAQRRANREQRMMIIYEDTNYSRMFVRPYNARAPRCTVMIETVSPESKQNVKPMTFDPTAGPWECRCGSVYAGEVRLALMDREESGTVPTERDANARLMAKAPELRAILSDLLEDFCYVTVQRSRASLQATEILNLIEKGNR